MRQARSQAARPCCYSAAIPGATERRRPTPGGVAVRSAQHPLPPWSVRRSSGAATVGVPHPRQRPLHRPWMHPDPKVSSIARPRRPSAPTGPRPGPPQRDVTISSVSLCARRGPGRAGTDPGRPSAAARPPPGRTTGGKAGTRPPTGGTVDPDPAHHLVLDLDQVPDRRTPRRRRPRRSRPAGGGLGCAQPAASRPSGRAYDWPRRLVESHSWKSDS